MLLAWLGVCPLLGAETGVDDPYGRGLQAYRAGRYPEALSVWYPLAEGGDALAQFSVGTLYDQGRGVPKDDARATAWFRRAAEQGHAAAQHNLGNAYKHGRGVPPGDAEAVLWWQRAAEQGVAGAQFNLAAAYLHGEGVARDRGAALLWYRRAAENGHALAARMVAEIEDGREAGEIAPEAGPAPATPAAGPRPGPGAGAEWVLAQRPGHYTIQVLSGTSEGAVRAELERLALPGPVAVYPYRHQGGRRFALLHGAFPDRAAASEALRALPPALRRSAPWVRAFRELQALGVDGRDAE